MNNAAFLVFIVERFSNESPSTSFLTPDGISRPIELAELESYENPIVTHDANVLVDALRVRGIKLPGTVIDIAEALRLRSQISKDQGGPKFWNPWREGREYFANRADCGTLEKLFEARVVPPNSAELQRLTADASSVLRSLWNEVVDDLRKIGEWTRFEEKEIPVQQIFHHRQYLGIRLDLSNLANYIKSCEQEKFTQFRKISTWLGFSPIGLPYLQIAQKLFELETTFSSEMKHSDGLEDHLEISKENSQMAFGLLTYIKASRDLTVLRQLQSSKERSHPYFQVHGTVTSRIMVTEPRLQQLRKRYRSILAADEGMELLYLDYAQFEPGILASLSMDQELLSAYESSDLYCSLSKQIYGDEHARDIAKKIFLAYCYGMKKSRIALLLADRNSQALSVEECEKAVGDFFARFPGIERYRQAIQEELLREGSVRSLLGNARRRDGDGPLTSKEERWAMNQTVQGTASLIFKDALVELGRRFGSSSILLPMHDAVLLQFQADITSREDFEREAISIMVAAFKRYCPNITPKITNAPFATN